MRYLGSRLVIWCACLLVQACATLQGTVVEGRYQSPTGAFSCTVPSAGPDLTIDDAADAYGELVRFHVPYSLPTYRVEYFYAGGDPLTRVDPSADAIDQLREFSGNVISFQRAASHAIQAWTPVLDKQISLGDRDGYFLIIRMTPAPPSSMVYERAFLFFRAKGAFVVLQYQNTPLHDLDEIEARTVYFYRLCGFRDAA